MDSLGQFGHYIMIPLYWITSVILSGFHHVFGALLGQDSGAGWVLSIIGLTLVIRAALIPLFVKQIKSSRNMQLLQPKVKELQKKYGHDRERLAQETMALYKETGTNPFASCLPIILQMPIFFALFRLIDHSANGEVISGVHVLDRAQVDSLAHAHFFGVQIADTFNGSGDVHVKIFAAVMVIIMTATTFLTQRQLMSKNMPADAMTGQYAQQQKMLLYVLPVVFAVGGIAFPIGVLFYWVTSNLWTMGQQFYVIRNNPAPGTPAAKAKEARDARHGKTPPTAPPAPAANSSGKAAAVDEAENEDKGPQQPRRQQPKKRSRSQRKKQPPARGSAGSHGQGTAGPGRRSFGEAAGDEGDEGEEPGRNTA
ncbi:MAG TPA: membrane protein insertase YidC [Nocardioidaceae bacterium]|nr:membrane protein insertase YidC [Nocardioidaceae bacterium]